MASVQHSQMGTPFFLDAPYAVIMHALFAFFLDAPYTRTIRVFQKGLSRYRAI